MRRLTSIAIACSVTLETGCFSDRLAPPTFRFSCSYEGECTEPEACIRGLCQVPCTQATFRQDCPDSGSYAACFNGVCSNVCTIGEDHCTEPHSCIELPLDAGGSMGSPGGRGSAGVDEIGICGERCTPSNGICPAGEQCLQGFCVQGCMFDAECQPGFACIFGICIPEEDVPDPSETGTNPDGDSMGPGDETSTGGAS